MFKFYYGFVCSFFYYYTVVKFFFHLKFGFIEKFPKFFTIFFDTKILSNDITNLNRSKLFLDIQTILCVDFIYLLSGKEPKISVFNFKNQKNQNSENNFFICFSRSSKIINIFYLINFLMQYSKISKNHNFFKSEIYKNGNILNISLNNIQNIYGLSKDFGYLTNNNIINIKIELIDSSKEKSIFIFKFLKLM